MTVYFHGQAYTAESLNTLSTKELLAVYNKLKGGKPVSRFESHSKAIIRTWDALQAYAAEVVVQDAIDNPTPNSNIDVPALEDDATAAMMGQQAAAKPASKVDRLLEVLRGLPDGCDITALSCALGCDAKRVRGLIDSARSRHGKDIIVRATRATFRIGE